MPVFVRLSLKRRNQTGNCQNLKSRYYFKQSLKLVNVLADRLHFLVCEGKLEVISLLELYDGYFSVILY